MHSLPQASTPQPFVYARRLVPPVAPDSSCTHPTPPHGSRIPLLPRTFCLTLEISNILYNSNAFFVCTSTRTALLMRHEYPKLEHSLEQRTSRPHFRPNDTRYTMPNSTHTSLIPPPCQRSSLQAPSVAGMTLPKGASRVLGIRTPPGGASHSTTPHHTNLHQHASVGAFPA